MDMIEIDGQAGGGQLLRSALSLSLCTGIGFSMQRIRAQRSRPGLMRQHLTAVLAAAEIGRAYVDGAQLGAMSLRFEPGTVTAGEYRFATGTAGSTTLVLQTLLPALWRCATPSRLLLEGGTHNPMAPSADFIADTYLPSLRKLGVQASLRLQRHGFYPAGGGVLHADVAPSQLRSIVLNERGERVGVEGVALLSALAAGIGRRELAVLGERLGLGEDALKLEPVRAPVGPGNAVLVRVRHDAHEETFAGYGERGMLAERVAENVAAQAAAYLDSTAYASEHLADQLLLPMALAGGGEFTTTTISEHLSSNARLIEKFLPVEIDWQPLAPQLWRVSVSS
ncbi:RNA 3'-terminal phosphate cyclase [Lysobacter silvisoli]|uniref:RNA 3'-terminal phosphate cyclase n=2 Tax=Lysobacter silvisoli TaxID=2293254 RepID=A0A371JYU6_9GAMM|nr:RNA 3'-terminal phosphate cyclase [Lysobacter silvisoli]